MKSFFKISTIALLTMLLWPTPCLADNLPVTLSLNQQTIEMDTPGYIESGRTYLPIRFMVQAMGAQSIEWRAEEKLALITMADNSILQLAAEKSIASLDDETIEFSKPLPFHDGRLFVPIAELKDYLDFSISYNPQTIHVNIDKEEIVVAQDMIADPIDEEALLWLSRIVEVEAKGQPLENKIAVANVVLNRVESNDFPDTVYDVIFQVDVHTQFPPAHKDGFTDMEPSDESWQAAKVAMLGSNNIEDCLYFNNQPFSSIQERFFTEMNGEYFYR